MVDGSFSSNTPRGVYVSQSRLESHVAQQTPVIPSAPTSSTAPKYFRSEFEKGKKEDDEEPSLEKKVDLKDDPFAGQ